MPQDDSPRPHDFLPLHPLEFRILLALQDEARHGYRIVKEIEAQEPSWSRIFPANLYRRLRDLLERGLLSETDPPEGADPRRRYFRLTPLGSKVALHEARRLEALVLDARARGVLPERAGGKP